MHVLYTTVHHIKPHQTTHYACQNERQTDRNEFRIGTESKANGSVRLMARAGVVGWGGGLIPTTVQVYVFLL